MRVLWQYIYSTTTVTKYCSHNCASKACKARKRIAKIDEANTQTTLIKQKVFDNIDSKPYLSISEACKLIGVARQTIYNLIYKGELSMEKFGSRTIIRRADIDELLNKYTMPTTKSSATITEYYNAKEIECIYNIKYGRLNEIINKNHIPKKLYKISYMYQKSM